jgi:hypothetical protein
MPIVPIFLLSLPRSGSTLTQRVIAAHDGISTVSEPWLLLPFLDTLRRPMPMQSTYHAAVAIGFEDFVRALPGGEAEYLAEVRRFSLKLYERVADPGARFFVDKTVHYFLIVDLLLEAFPGARFIFLWRNPLSVIASMVETLGQGRWVMARHRLELFHGVHDLVRAYDRNRDRVHAVRYEDLLTGRGAWEDLMAYVGVPFDRAALSEFSEVALVGRRGDQIGSRRYTEVSSEPLGKWRRTLGNPIRVAWCRRYLRWIGRDRLEVMGYDLDRLLSELDAIETRPDGTLHDSLDLLHAAGRELWRARMPDNRLASSWRTLASVPRAEVPRRRGLFGAPRRG